MRAGNLLLVLVCTLETPNRWESLIFCPIAAQFCCQKTVTSGSCCDDSALLMDISGLPAYVMSTLHSLNAASTSVIETSNESPTTPTSLQMMVSQSVSTTFLITSTPALASPTAPSSAPSSMPIATNFQISNFSGTLSTLVTVRSSSTTQIRPTFTTDVNYQSQTSIGMSQSDKITLGYSLGLAMPTLLVALFAWLFPQRLRVYVMNHIRYLWPEYK